MTDTHSLSASLPDTLDDVLLTTSIGSSDSVPPPLSDVTAAEGVLFSDEDDGTSLDSGIAVMSITCIIDPVTS